jgi:hypothetical protein
MVKAPTIILFGDIKLGGRLPDLGTRTKPAPTDGTNYDQTDAGSASWRQEQSAASRALLNPAKTSPIYVNGDQPADDVMFKQQDLTINDTWHVDQSIGE